MSKKSKPNIHTATNPNAKSPDEKWANKAEGKSKPISTARTKQEAEKLGKQAAKTNESEHIIHKMDGTIAEKNSYGNDPKDIKG